MHNSSQVSNTEIDNREGIVFNIQDYSIHDGPGIRTVVFLKGCPLSCTWCSNPESQSIHAEIGILKKRCRKCLKCVEACPEGAVHINDEGTLVFSRELCIRCGYCEDACPYGVRKLFGKKMKVEDVVGEVLRSAPFYTRSGGGVTVSGGEPTLQGDFLSAIMLRCKQKYIHTALETCGYIQDRKLLARLMQYTDLFLFDIKIMDAQKHKRFTGVTNELIINNARFISRHKRDMIVRIPIIPGFNDSIEELEKIGLLGLELESLKEINLIPYHAYGSSKYVMLDKPFSFKDVPEIPMERILHFKEFIEDLGLRCVID